MAKHGIILVGAGDMGGHHSRAWTEIGQPIVAIVDIDGSRAQKLADRYHVERTFDDYQTAISEMEDADIVDVSVPLDVHLPVTVAAARAKKHVLCEKPLARDLEEADAMQEAVSAAGIKFAVGFQRNLAPGVAFLQEEVRAGHFGRPLLFTADGMGEVRPKRFMHDRFGNNGPVVDLMQHYFLLWETVFESEPVAIEAFGFIAASERPEIAHFKERAIDTAVVTVRYRSGDVGTMTVSWGLAAGTRLPSLPERLIGPKQAAIAGPFRDFSWQGWTIYDGPKEEYHPFPAVYPHALQAQAFIDYVEGKRQAPPSTLQEGKRLLRLSLAALTAIETGQVVAL